MTTIAPRPEVAALEAVVHGAIGERELAPLGLRPEHVVDFSVNSNPLGPSPHVAAVLTEATAAGVLARYPDDSAARLCAALAKRYGVGLDQVVAGNGSAELIWLLALAFVWRADPVAILGPTFGEYARAVQLMGGRVHEYHATRVRAFDVDLDDASAWLRQTAPRLAFICNPNNPTGHYFQPAEIVSLLAALPETLLVIDEAYVAFTRGDTPPAPDQALVPLLDSGRVVLLRSMTKDYALAGLRLGYALGSPAVVDALRRARPPWSVNAFAQLAGLASLADDQHLARSRVAAQDAVVYLREGLGKAGYRVFPTQANFLLVEVGNAPAIRRRLLAEGLVVRDCASFGLPNIIRVAARPIAECERLVAAMRSLREGGDPADGSRSENKQVGESNR